MPYARSEALSFAAIYSIPSPASDGVLSRDELLIMMSQLRLLKLLWVLSLGVTLRLRFGHLPGRTLERELRQNVVVLLDWRTFRLHQCIAKAMFEVWGIGLRDFLAYARPWKGYAGGLGKMFVINPQQSNNLRVLSKVVSTHLWNTPLNLHQRAINRDLFHSWRTDWAR